MASGEGERKGGEGPDIDPAEADRLAGARMALAQAVFVLRLPAGRAGDGDRAAAAEQLMEAIAKDGMSVFYAKMVMEGLLVEDEALMAKMKAANEAEEAKLDEREKDAKDNHGEAEQLEAAVARADFHERIGDKDTAQKLYDAISPKKLSSGQKIDIALKGLRSALFYTDLPRMKDRLEQAHKLVEEGGDWDRRNRLKIYEGAYAMLTRDFARAAELFVSALATFNGQEVFPYTSFIFYAVITSMKALNRVDLKTKIVDSPDVLSAILEIPHLSEFLNSLYECRYRDFFAELVEIESHLARDRYLARHTVWFVREMRVTAYSQFLESYRSVTTESMASMFGVSPAFIDSELSKFIASGRVNAKIDKVAGVVETNRPDVRNAQYKAVVQKGDLLLNRLGSLSRALRV